MQEAKDELEPKWRDHELRVPKPSTQVLNADNLRQFADDVMDDLRAFIERLNSLFTDESQEWALGRRGEPGDPVKIDHYAQRIISLYDELMDWSARVRGIRARPEYTRLVGLAAQFADLPLRQMRAFFDDFVREVSTIPARIEAGERVRLNMTLRLDIDNAISDAFLREYERVLF
jgi:hypothetical protein